MPDQPTPGQAAAPVAGASASTPAPVTVSRKETDAFILRLIGRYGSAESALAHLGGEQIRYRKRAQAAEAAAADLQKKVPAAGAVVLVGDEAKAYEEIKKSGVTLDKVPAQLATLKELQSKDTSMSRESALKMAAGEGDAAKYKLKVLTKLLGDVPLEFKKVNVKGKDKDGKDTIEEQQVPYVVLGTGTAQTRELLDTYLEREHADFAEVLKADGETGGSTTPPANTGGSTGGVQTLPQRNTPKGGKTDDTFTAVDRQITGKYLTPGQRAKAEAGAGKT